MRILYQLRRKLLPRYRTLRVTNMLKKQKFKDMVVVELGSNTCKNAVTWMYNLPIKKAYLVDLFNNYITFEGKMDNYGDGNIRFAKAVKRMKKFGDKAKVIKADAIKVAESIPDNLDYVRIDINPTYDLTLKALETWFPKLKIGGYISGHGFRSTNIEETRAVLNFIDNHQDSLSFSGRCNEYWIKKEK